MATCIQIKCNYNTRDCEDNVNIDLVTPESIVLGIYRVNNFKAVYKFLQSKMIFFNELSQIFRSTAIITHINHEM